MQIFILFISIDKEFFIEKRNEHEMTKYVIIIIITVDV